MNRARAAAAALCAVALLAARVPADAVPVPPAAWTPAAGLLIFVLIAVTSVAAARHYRNRPARTTPEERKEGASPQ